MNGLIDRPCPILDDACCARTVNVNAGPQLSGQQSFTLDPSTLVPLTDVTPTISMGWAGPTEMSTYTAVDL